MGEGRPSDGYQITNARIPILLILKRIRELKPHEQTVKEDLERLTAAMAREPVLRHPIISDNRTGLVLDGTHRLAALAQLGCELITCAAIDYQDPSIVVERWFREMRGTSLDKFRESIQSYKSFKVGPNEAERWLQNRSGFASIQNTESCFVLVTPDKNVSTLTRCSFEIEEIARRKGLKIAYSDDNSVPNGTDEFLLSTIRLNKQEIITASASGKVFPPKTTRHIIPSRPLGISFPLDLLRSIDLERAQEEFVLHLRKLRIRRLPGGAWIGSRRYEEEVFLFE